MFTHRITIKTCADTAHTNTYLIRMHKHQKSHESANISSIKTGQSLHTAAPLAGGTEINRQLSGDALQYVTRQAARKQLAGRGRRVQTPSEECNRERGQGRGRLPKQIDYINLSLASSVVCVHVLNECVYVGAHVTRLVGRNRMPSPILTL